MSPITCKGRRGVTSFCAGYFSISQLGNGGAYLVCVTYFTASLQAERVVDKFSVTVYRCLRCLVARYLAWPTSFSESLLQLVDVRSSSSAVLVARKTRFVTVDDRAFQVAGSRVWNSLPSDVTSAPTIIYL